MSRLTGRLQDVPGIKVFILDACRENPFATRMFRRRDSGGEEAWRRFRRTREPSSLMQQAQAIPPSMAKEVTALTPRHLSIILATQGVKSA